MIGWTPPDGEGRRPTPADEARRAAFMLFFLVAVLCGVVGWARFPWLLWVAAPSAVVAVVLLLAPVVADARRERDPLSRTDGRRDHGRRDDGRSDDVR